MRVALCPNPASNGLMWSRGFIATGNRCTRCSVKFNSHFHYALRKARGSTPETCVVPHLCRPCHRHLLEQLAQRSRALIVLLMHLICTCIIVGYCDCLARFKVASDKIWQYSVHPRLTSIISGHDTSYSPKSKCSTTDPFRRRDTTPHNRTRRVRVAQLMMPNKVVVLPLI